MALADIHTSFGGGELSKNLYARVDLDKYHVGAAKMRNWFSDFRGGASTRAGFQFIGRTRSSGTPIIIPFSVSTAQTYIVELGELYARFYTSSDPVIASTEAITGITRANPGVISVAAIGAIANGKTVILSGIGGMKELNGRTFLVAGVAGSTFHLTDLDGNPIDTTLYSAWTAGGTVSLVYELVTPWHEVDFLNPDGTLALKFAQSADTMTIVHPLYKPYLLQRQTASTFTVTPMNIGPIQAAPQNLSVTTGSSGSDYVFYQVTAVSPDGKEESLPSNTDGVGNSSVDTSTKLDWDPPATGDPPSYYKIYKSTPAGGHVTASTFGFIGTSLTTKFDDKNIAPDFTKGPPLFNDPFTPDQPLGIIMTATGGGYSITDPPTVTFAAPPAGGKTATGRCMVDDSNGLFFAVIDFTGGPYSAGVPALTFSAGGAVGHVVGLSPDSGTYPSCCTYFQQRQCFAGSVNQPQNFWASQIGSQFNFDQALIPLDSDSVALGLASRQVNQIKCMIPMPTGLVLGTSGGAWLLSGGGTGTPITPANTDAAPQASSGFNDIPPLVVNNDIIYVQSRGAVVRSLVFNFYVQSYFGTDRSLLANHLFFGHTLTDAAFCEEPFRIGWFVRDDGKLLALTYVPEQEIYAWSHHDTAGLVKRVASVVEGQEDVLYILVQRLVNGVWKNFIERQSSRNWQSQVEFCTCLDSFLQLGQTFPAATISFAANEGNAVLATTSSAVLAGNSSDVGQVIRGTFGGKAEIANFNTTSSCFVNIIEPFPTIEDTDDVIPLVADSWMLAAPVTVLRGLDQLAGKKVSALADGQVYTGLTVTSDGVVVLPREASYVTVGLPYQCQLQTLYLDLGDPTVQSKFKLTPQCELRLDDTRGIKIGATLAQFDGHMEEVTSPDPITFPPDQLFTGDIMSTMGGDWTTTGQLCILQDNPLPATVLGLSDKSSLGAQ